MLWYLIQTILPLLDFKNYWTIYLFIAYCYCFTFLMYCYFGFTNFHNLFINFPSFKKYFIFIWKIAKDKKKKRKKPLVWFNEPNNNDLRFNRKKLFPALQTSKISFCKLSVTLIPKIMQLTTIFIAVRLVTAENFCSNQC